MTGCFRNREKIADDLQARGLHDFSQQRIFFLGLRLLCSHWRNAEDGCLASAGIWNGKESKRNQPRQIVDLK